MKKINIEEKILKNIDIIEVFTEFDDDQLHYNVKVKTNDKNNSLSSILDLYKEYLTRKYDGDYLKIVKNYINKFRLLNMAAEIEERHEIKNNFKMEILEVTFNNGKKLIINVPISYKGHKTPLIDDFLSKLKYYDLKYDLIHDINELLLNYYNSFDINNLILFYSNKIYVNLHGKPNIENSDSLYFFFNKYCDYNILNYILNDFLNNNLELINGLKIHDGKLKCTFSNGKSLEVPIDLDLIKEILTTIENTFLDNNRSLLIKKKV